MRNGCQSGSPTIVLKGIVQSVVVWASTETGMFVHRPERGAVSASDSEDSPVVETKLELAKTTHAHAAFRPASRVWPCPLCHINRLYPEACAGLDIAGPRPPHSSMGGRRWTGMTHEQFAVEHLVEEG